MIGFQWRDTRVRVLEFRIRVVVVAAAAESQLPRPAPIHADPVYTAFISGQKLCLYPALAIGDDVAQHPPLHTFRYPNHGALFSRYGKSIANPGNGRNALCGCCRKVSVLYGRVLDDVWTNSRSNRFEQSPASVKPCVLDLGNALRPYLRPFPHVSQHPAASPATFA